MLAQGMIKTIEDENDIYISLTQLCDFFVQSSANMKKEIADVKKEDEKFAMGLYSMMHTLSQELVELGIFEAQRRMIESPEDLLKMIDKHKGSSVE